MKTFLIPDYHLLARMAISLQLIIIAVAIPSASLADINYYKALFLDYFKNPGYHRNHDAGHNDQNLVQHG